MSTMQRLTLIGMSNYDSTLFDALTLPDGYDKETFVNSLLLEHGEKCVLYTNPEFFKHSMEIWSDKWALELSRIYAALTAEYNPIWNYDRNESWGDKAESSTNAGHKATDSPDFDVEQTTSGEVEHLVSADNDSNYQPESKDITNTGKTKTSGKTQDLSETSNSKTNDSSTHNGHIWGNIGVTTSTQMVESETLIRAKRNLYDIATRLFANELLIGIY